eukprot:CAMPEP_0174278556 /NCGR_PEP_ID=MMETSP0439-20130205/61545_1 /TAXON_ID=0 /ORGANISM="Stereomyxa ramosa, Strain Chinc5" /LENGTH=558 /DNA_ID=CAMNT_0015370985 /DNA_START=667 /DNA_END=2339 /DNA_ORIENTATION=+
MSKRKLKSDPGKEMEPEQSEEEEEDAYGCSVFKSFKQKVFLNKNWLSGRCTRLKFEAHSKEPVNDLKFVTNTNLNNSGELTKLVTCSDDKTIKIWKNNANVESGENNENNKTNYVRSSEEEENEERCEDNNNNSSGNDLNSTKPRKKLFSFKSSKVKSVEPRRYISASEKKGDLVDSWNEDIIAPSCSTVLTGHNSLIWTLDYDKNLIISGSHDQSVIIWNEEEGSMARKFIQVLPGGVNQIYMQDSLAFASGRASKEMKLLDIEAGKEAVTYKASDYGGIFASTVDWEEQSIIVTDGKLLKIYDFRGGDYQHRIVLGSVISRFEVLKKRGSNILATGDADGDCKFWDLRKLTSSPSSNGCKELATFSHGLVPVCEMYMDSTKLVSGDKGGVVKVFDLKTMQLNSTNTSTTTLQVDDLWCFQANDRALVCGDSDGRSNILATGDADGDCKFWDLRKLTSSSSSNGFEELAIFTHGLVPICDMYMDNTKLVSGDKGGMVKVFDLKTIQFNARNTSSTTLQLNDLLWCFQADDRALVCGDRTGFINILDFQTDFSRHSDS